MLRNIDEIGMGTKSLADDLGDNLGLPVTISCPSDRGMIVRYASVSHDPNLKNTYQEGFVFSYVSSAAGLAFIAAARTGQREKLLDPLRIATTDQKDAAALSASNFEEKLDRIHKRGYAFLWGQLNGIVALAVPIKSNGDVVGALSVRSSDTALREKSMVEKYLSPLSDTAKAIALSLTHPS